MNNITISVEETNISNSEYDIEKMMEELVTSVQEVRNKKLH